MALRTRLDWTTVVRGALLVLLISVPPIAIVRLVKGDELAGEESYWWVIAVIALFVGFFTSGYVSAQRQPSTPMLHSAATALVAFAVFALFTVVRRLVAGDGLSAALLTTLLLLAQITVSLALLGGYVAMRRLSSLR